MEAIILAGGFGTRLRNLVSDVPKPMAPVAGRPFLELLLSKLEVKGIDRIIVSVGYLADQIISHFGSRYRTLSISYIKEAQPLGTGGAIRLALTRCVSDHAFVFNGDTFLDLEAVDVETMWESNRRPIVVARQVEDSENFGRLLVDNGRLIGFTEKGVCEPGLINAGCYVFGSDQLNAFPLYKPFSIERDYFPRAVLTTHFDVFVSSGAFIDIGTPVDYVRANEFFAGRE